MSSIQKVLRTPEDAFAGIHDFDYKPSYFTSRLFGAEVRIAYYDVAPITTASGELIVLPHGEPTWSYLNRKLVTPLAAKGHRVLMFDQVGFGRSDKPAEDSDYTYDRHVAWNEDLLINHLGITGATFVLQDWGGLLGLRVAARHPARFSRLVIANTFLPTGNNSFYKINQGFYNWKKFARKTGLAGPGSIGKMISISVGDLVLSDKEKAAYDAPFPTEEHKAGARRFPELVVTPDDDPTGRPQAEGRVTNEACWAVFKAWTKPVLCVFCEGDAVMVGGEAVWVRECPGAKDQKHVTFKGGGHFIQDCCGPELADAVINFIAQTPAASKERAKL